MTCTFFGHRNAPQSIEDNLRSVLIDLIKNKGVDNFYVGNQGEFDSMVKLNLKRLAAIYPHIKYAVVLACLPTSNKEFACFDYSYTIFPDGMENVPPRFAIDMRNRWIIEISEYVVVYVRQTLGGAAKFKSLAEKKKRTVINLADK